MKLYFDDVSFDGQLQRSVGKADSGMANVGECLAIAEQVTPGDRDSWYRAWSGFAARLVSQGDEAAKAGHRVSARGAYLRATEYFRQAFFFHRENLDGTELRTAYASSVRAFRSALGHFEHPGRVLSGPVPGYLFTPGHTSGKCPAILHIGGYDGTAEELYAAAAPAVERGYAFAALDGPGQGAVLYDQRVPMRPDWENVVPGMFDAVIAYPEIDPGRVALVGRSFGGLIAPRGAAGEHRLAAMIVDPGQYDLGTAATARLGPMMDQVDDPAADPQFNSLLDIPAVKAFLGPRMTTHGVTSVQDILRRHSPLHQRRHRDPGRLSDFRHGQRDRRGLDRPGQDPLRPPHLPQGVPAFQEGRGRRRPLRRDGSCRVLGCRI